MDTVTQVALGAAVGEAVLGRNVGRKAAVWGALCGLAPDLDVFWPYTDAMAAFTWHRAYSHSFVVLALATPIIAWAATRIHPATRPYGRGWLMLVFLSLVTHPILDCFTVYGTQVLMPFSDLPVGWGTIFIIDPVFSVPLVLGVAAGLIGRRRDLGHLLSNVGLAVAVAWLACTVAIKAHVDRVAGESVAAAGTTRLLTVPTPFNAVLWRMVAMTGEGDFLEGYYSLFDAERRFSFVSRPDGHVLLQPLRAEAPVARLMWFSRDFFAGREREGGAIVISDLRMGLEERYAFSFVVGRREGQAVAPVPVRQEPDAEYPSGWGEQLWDRILGRSSNPACILGC